MNQFKQWEDRLYPSLIKNIEYIIEKTPINGVVYDIGANTGLLSQKVYEQRPDIKFVLFEPIKRYHEEVIRKFGNNSNFICLNVALLDENKDLEISIHYENLGLNTLSFISNYGNKETVVGTTLYDCYVNNSLPLPDFIKIDVEHAEHFVIEGARKLFEIKKPTALLIEIGVMKTSPLWEEEYSMIEYLFSLGYKRFENSYTEMFDAKFEL